MQKRSPLPGRRAGVKHSNSDFLEAFDNVKRLLIWELNLNVLTNAYEFIPFILSALVVALLSLWGDGGRQSQ